MNIIDYITESCDMQNAKTPKDYAGFALAYAYVYDTMWVRSGERGGDKIFMSDLAPIICLIHGNVKWVEFRCQPASFANGDVTTTNNRETILRVLTALVAAQRNFSPTSFYCELELIHPWPDGNGRIGSLLWNFLNGTIADPVHPPNLFPPVPIIDLYADGCTFIPNKGRHNFRSEMCDCGVKYDGDVF